MSVSWLTLAQPVHADFSIQATACLQENFLITNLSTQADRFEWDVCQGDLNLTPIGSILGNVTGSAIPTGLDFVYDGTSAYGFVASRDNNSIIRISLDPTFSNVTSVLNLGNIGSLLNRPVDIRIVTDNGNWYGFVFNEGANVICRLDFGTSLSNLPTAVVVLSSSPPGFNQGFDVIRSGTLWYIVYTYNAKVGILRLSTIESIPAVSDQLVTGDLIGSPDLGDIKIIEQAGSFFAYCPSYSTNKLFRLSFGSNLFSIPTETDISSGLPGSFNYFGLDGGYDVGNFYLFLSTLQGSLIRINLGNDLTQTPASVQNLGDLSVLSSTLKNKLIRQGSNWTSLSVDFNSGNLFKVSFPTPACQFTPGLLTNQNPVLQFNSGGVKYISLTSFKGGAEDQKNKSITISSLIAPTVDFTYQNICVQNPTNFTIQASQSLTSTNWDFGNGSTSTQTSPSITYSAPGPYNVTLTATSINGCSNYLSKQTTIYNQPVAEFILPTNTPLCTNHGYVITNTSSFDAGSNPSWEWRLNGTLISTQQNLTALFTSPASQEVRLKALIPGCENQKIKTIATVITGPAINFSANDNCQGNSVLFINTTTGVVDAGYNWSFGDATNSTQTNPSHAYSAPATYQIMLTGSNSQGCQNSQTKAIKIYSLPQPDFSVSIPPFSCNNSPTPFQNITPPLTDSNITAWSWQFGDAAGGTSQQQNPSYSFPLAGNFNVKLSTVSDAGCSFSITKPVTIALSPTSDFTVGPSCLNQSTKFTDISSGGIQSRMWQLGASSFGVPNPSYTFTSAGDFPATLTVTGANGCSNVKTKVIHVPVPPVLNFSATNPCAGKNTVFSDVTSSPAEGIVGWNWNFAGNSLTGNPVENNFAAKGTYNVQLTTTHASGCKYTLSKNVLINPSPVASFIALPDRGAPPLTVQFENTSQQAVSYAWKFYDKVIATSTRISPVYTFASLGDYSAELTATSAQGCSDVRTVPIKVLVPSIDLILKNFSLVNDPVTGKLKASVTILNNSNVPVSSAEIVLFLSDKAVVNETIVLNLNPDQSVAKTLSFSLSPNQFDFSFLCAEINSERDFQPDNNKRCINLSNTDYFFGPYPNPTTGRVHVDWISEKSGVTRIVVYDAMGKKSYEWETSSQSGLNQAILDLEFLSTGLYYLTVETSGSKKTTRFLRQ